MVSRTTTSSGKCAFYHLYIIYGYTSRACYQVGCRRPSLRRTHPHTRNRRREVVARAAAAREVVAREVAATEVAMVAVVTAEEVMARMQESKRGSLQG